MATNNQLLTANNLNLDSGIGTGTATVENPDYGAGFIDPWGFITHGETVAVNNSKVKESYRRRNITHTLRVSGVLLRTNHPGVTVPEPQIPNLKDRLQKIFYSDPSALQALGQAFYPSVPDDSSIVVWEPQGIEWEPGSWVEEAKYTATLIAVRYPSSTEVSTNQTITHFGIQFWDKAQVNFRRNYDRITKKINQTKSVSGTIKCPDNMPWGEWEANNVPASSLTPGTAAYYYQQLTGLRASAPPLDDIDTPGTPEGEYYEENEFGEIVKYSLTDIEFSSNIDEQTVTFNATGTAILDPGNTGGIVNLFGHDWPAIADISIENTPLRDSHLGEDYFGSVSYYPMLQRINFSLTLGVPEDVEDMNTAFTHYSYAMQMQQGKVYPSFGQAAYKNLFGSNTEAQEKGWEIKSVTPTFSYGKRTVGVTITAERVINRGPILKDLAITSGSTGFLWRGASLSRSFTSEVETLIYAESVTASAQAQIPNDMTEAEALAIVQDINALKPLDGGKYPGFKVMSKDAAYDRFSRQLTFSINFKKLDFFDPYRYSGGYIENSPKDADREVYFNYGVFSKITGKINFYVNYEESYEQDENQNRVRRFSVNGRLLPDHSSNFTFTTPAKPGDRVNKVLDEIWNIYVNQDSKLSSATIPKLYRVSSCSRRIDIATMEGAFNLSFTDDGRGDGVKGNGIWWPTKLPGIGRSDQLFIIKPQFNTKEAGPRWITMSDNVSDGMIFQEGGLDLKTISMQGTVEKKIKDYTRRIDAIKRAYAKTGGYIDIKNVYGRVESPLTLQEDPFTKNVTVSISIQVQPLEAVGAELELIEYNG